MSQIQICPKCGEVGAMGDGECRGPREGSLAASDGSAIEHQNRRRVWEELDAVRTWSARLEAGLQKEPDGVIPWLQLESLHQATSRLLYAAGHVNAVLLSQRSESK